MSIERTYRRLNKARRLANSGEAESVLTAAHEILATRLATIPFKHLGRFSDWPFAFLRVCIESEGISG
jgi:hypothetical protein